MYNIFLLHCLQASSNFEFICYGYASCIIYISFYITIILLTYYYYYSGSKVNSAFHPSEVDKMSTRKFWELVVKSKLPP